MLPSIVIFSNEVSMYGIMAALGALISILYLKLAEKRYPALEADCELALIYAVIGVFAGAKLLYLLTVRNEFVSDLQYLTAETIPFLKKYLYGGFVFYGGLIGAVTAVLLYCKAEKADTGVIVSVLAPIIPLFHCFGRLGCFFAGCCYGREALACEWGIELSKSDLAPHGVRLIPVQLYEAAGVLLIFALLVMLYRSGKSGAVLLCVYGVCYSVLRFILEFFRGDAARGFIGIFSLSQAISAAVFLLSITAAAIRKIRLQRDI